MNLNNNYWDNRWKNKETNWDIGTAAPALVEYCNQLIDKNISILIPGCGNSYEAKALLQLGFSNITLIDISETLVNQLKSKYKDEPKIKIVLGDFFEHNAQYDLVLEQTFFCALPPAIRPQYAQKVYEVLKQNGKLVGVLFNRNFEVEGPPFGGDAVEYQTYFSSLFDIHKMELCNNSIAPRAGNELFINLTKKI